MVPNENLEKDLQTILNRFVKPFPKEFDFAKTLFQFVELYEKLSHELKKDYSKRFWNRVEAIGTPIIEELDDESVKVHFLFPQFNYEASNKVLYIAGDFHGYVSTNDKRQKMHQQGETDIMYRSDIIPKDSVVYYQFIQVDEEFGGHDRPYFSGPTEGPQETFYPREQQNIEFKPPLTKDGEDPFLNSSLVDEFSLHKNPPMTMPGMSFFCANISNDITPLNIKQTSWPEVLSSNPVNNQCNNLQHSVTYYCNHNDELIVDRDIEDDYFDKRIQDESISRTVSIFEPPSRQVDNLIIISDGLAYLQSNTLQHIDDLIQQNQIPKNTAIVLVTTMPGLAKRYHSNGDSRLLEFGDHVEEYTQFIYERIIKSRYQNVPVENRMVVGSSMSGTASLYMLLEHGEVFGKAFVQAPSYGNRDILRNAVYQMQQNSQQGIPNNFSDRVFFSCGYFDSLEYAQNLGMSHTIELATILSDTIESLPIHTGNYGHGQFQSWSKELMIALPKLYSGSTHEVEQGKMMLPMFVQKNSTPQVKYTTTSIDQNNNDDTSKRDKPKQ